mgnify:CR=1 FL=1
MIRYLPIQSRDTIKYKHKIVNAMKTRNFQAPKQNSTGKLDLFASSRLNSNEMFNVRGGEEKKKDLSDEGSTAPQQDDGFN